MPRPLEEEDVLLHLVVDSSERPVDGLLLTAETELHRRLLDCLTACFTTVPELKKTPCAQPG